MADVPEPELKWTVKNVGDAPKKEVVEWFQANGTFAFLKQHKLTGDAQRTAKSRNKKELVAAYTDITTNKLYATEEQRAADKLADDMAKAKIAEEKEAEKSSAADGAGGGGDEQKLEDYVEINTIKKGTRDIATIKKGSQVKIVYTGKLEDGTVFDTNDAKKARQLAFKVGAGRVIRGWDEGLIGMGAGEEATLVIKPEWAYGKKGLPEGARVPIPPNATLTFDIKVCVVD